MLLRVEVEVRASPSGVEDVDEVAQGAAGGARGAAAAFGEHPVAGPHDEAEHQQAREAEHDARHVHQRRSARIGWCGCSPPSHLEETLVRHTLRPSRRHLQEPAREGPALRGRHRRDRPRDPDRAARGRRRAAGGQGVRGRGQGARAGRGGQPGAEPGPADRQDRQRGARQHPRRRDPAASLREVGADGHPARRPPGLRQDHARGQARAVAQGAGQEPAAGGRRPAAAERRPAAAGQRRACGCPGLRTRAGQRHRRPGGGGAGVDRGGQADPPRRGHRRHRRPAGCRLPS